MTDLREFFYFFKEKICLKITKENRVDTYGVFAHDYSTTVLATKMFTNFNAHSMYVIFLWNTPRFLL